MSRTRTIKQNIEMSIVSDYNNGLRSSVIAEKYGINRKTVSIVAKRNGCVIRDQRSASGRPIISPDVYVEKVVALRMLGMSQQKIADEIGMSQIVVSRTLRAAGMPTVEWKTGPSSANWKGGKVDASDGYIGVLVESKDPLSVMRSKQGYVLEHRLVMARSLGRPLTKRETVHHINGDKKDNRLENLQLRKGNHGTGAVFVCACCGSTNVVSTKLAEA